MKCRWIIGLGLLCVLKSALALEQHEKAWLAINKQQAFSENRPWLYSIYSQLRLIRASHPWQTSLFEGGIGYQFLLDKNIWLAYRWSGAHPNNGFYQENRLIQQLYAPLRQDNLIDLASRSRLEEIVRANESQMAIRFRERIALELKYAILKKINPYFYDEFFFRLNKTHFTSNSVLSENRLFLGFNFYLSKTHSLEIGYINQYQYKTPQCMENQMSHILSLTYNF